MAHDGDENLPRFDKLRQAFGPSRQAQPRMGRNAHKAFRVNPPECAKHEKPAILAGFFMPLEEG
ncbi:MAG: hypothetical protein VR73_12645 [Gammaproteobacteria bacterium BRH_c0]|nr:MAG: hypothetical protein VR73_12645 [Gammaproteobacteria bacterium BRH_c0]